MLVFYDTCALLNLRQDILKTTPFYISNITLKELENIKTSRDKDNEIKYQAREVIRLLNQNEDKYVIINYQCNWGNKMLLYPTLTDNNDSKIILSALSLDGDVLFVTSDLCCKALAQDVGLKTKYVEKDNALDYTGFVYLDYNTDEELADIYSKRIFTNCGDFLQPTINEYIYIRNKNTGEIVDWYKYTAEGKCEGVPYYSLSTSMFGQIKPKDVYQIAAIDSFRSNKITLLHGAAGTGKSYLSLGYLFYQLERHHIDKIIVFCNTVATANSARLGFYPGSRNDKLLDSQIGTFFASKLGDMTEVERLIDEGSLEILPMCDIRGYDSTGQHAGIYITEAQNFTVDLMKLALQRIGDDCICIIDGDTKAQVDSPIYNGDNNGMRRLSEVFRGDPAYGEVELQNIYRSHIAELAEQM